MLQDNSKKNKKIFTWLLILCSISIVVAVLKPLILKPSKITAAELRGMFEKGAKNISADEQQNKALVDCCMEKVKTNYPDLTNGIENDSLVKVVNTAINECAALVTKTSWTPLIEQALLKKVMALELLNDITVAQKTTYANCVLSKLKQKYPQGINGRIAEAEMDEIYRSCIEVLK